MKAREIKTLDDVRAFLGRIPNLHNGGCGVSAIAMTRWLKKYTKNPHVRYVLCYAKNNIPAFQRNSLLLSKEIDVRPDAASHAGIYYTDPRTNQTAPIDARGYLAIVDYEYTHVFREAAPMIKMVKARREWNHKFDRDHWVPVIEKRLGISLRDIL